MVNHPINYGFPTLFLIRSLHVLVQVREVTDLLDAVGNTTKAATKGFAISSAALACFLLFSAFMDEISLFTRSKFDVVDIALPEVFAGGIIGASLVMLFSSYTLTAVSEAAQQLVEEVRRQFRVRICYHFPY